jgi:anion-transporting  ArsA/GET3 family ATPase
MAPSPLERKLIVVTGKGGTGKTTVAAAIGLLAAGRGLRTLVAELGEQHRLPALFDRAPPHQSDAEVELERCLWGTSIDPRHALFEWLATIGGRMSVRMLAASSTFNYFAAAAPGAKELVTMIKARELCERPAGPDAQGYDADRHGDDRQARARRYDLVVLDAPASGHALAMLRSPQTFSAIVRVGPLADQAERVRELLESHEHTAYMGVTHATEMAVTETLELDQGLRRHLGRGLDVVLVNGTLPRRFTRRDLSSIEAIADDRTLEEPSREAALLRASARTARAVYERGRRQQAQLARLRRRRPAGGGPPEIVTIPFRFTARLDLAGVRDIAAMLDRKLQ